MRRPVIINVILWLVATAVVFGFMVKRPHVSSNVRVNNDARQAQVPDALIAPKLRWQSARAQTDPLRRLEASGAVIDSLSLVEIAEIFREALKNQDHELISGVGGAWIRKDPAGFIDALSDTPILGWDPLFMKPLMTVAYRQYAELDSAKALIAYQRMDPQSRLILARDAGSHLILRYLSDDPARVAALGESLALYRASFSHSTPNIFTGDVRKLAVGLTNMPPSEHREVFLQFLRHSILSDPLTGAAQARFSEWWRALPGDMQIETLPWDSDPDLLAHPGIRERLAERAMGEDAQSVATYMHHYGATWAEENPQEALEWVFERFDGRELSGPWHPMDRSLWSGTGVGIFISFDAEPLGKNANALTESLKAPIAALAREDPQQAIAHLADIDSLYIRSQLYPVIAKAWAETDRESALRWSQGLPGKWAREQSKSRITGERPPVF